MLQKNAIHKHHWLLAVVLVLVCSWITHTTTARISDNLTSEQVASFAELLEPIEVQPVAFESLVQPLEIDTLANFSAELVNNYRVVTHKITKGESLDKIFSKLALDGTLPYKISQNTLGKKLASLTIGKQLVFQIDDDDKLKQVSYPLNSLQNLIVDIDDQEVVNSHVADLPYQKKQNTASGEIITSFYEAAQQANLSNTRIMEMARIFGWDIDFIQDTRQGDSFHIIYEDYVLNQEKLTDGDILAAEYTNQGRTYRAIRYTDQNGNSGYYTPEGKSVIGAFLRSPVEFSRISSGFSKRRYHPILKKWRSHKGVDYAASRGTPVRATADGSAIHVGRKGGYGKTVVVRHPGQVKTLYAHLNGYARNLRSGKRVKQGDIIGYVGSTGLSTGPHLHYEFQVGNVHRNPLTQKPKKASAIKQDQLANFAGVAHKWIAKLDSMSQIKLAQSQIDSANKQL